MKTEVQASKAYQAKLNSQNHMFGMNKYSQAGRVYQSQKYSGPLAKRSTRILSHEERKQRVEETVYAQNIVAVEKYLGGKTRKSESIVEDYGLSCHSSGAQYSKGSGEAVFKVLCEKFPLAKNYKGWGDIYYSMKNGHVVRREPMKTEKIKVDEHFAIDDCKPLYKRGDTVYIVNLAESGFSVFKGEVVSYYIKELRSGVYDIMYEIKAPCFGLTSGWKLQGNRTVFASKEEAEARAREKNNI